MTKLVVAMLSDINAVEQIISFTIAPFVRALCALKYLFAAFLFNVAFVHYDLYLYVS